MQIGVEVDKLVENKRLFIVDDDEITSAALQFMLHDENETHEIPSIEAALTKARDWKPDVILLGSSVLSREGKDVVHKLKNEIDGLKILYVAESKEDPLTTGFREHAIDGILTKPLTIESTRRKVDRLLGRKVTLGIPVQVI